MMAIKQSTRQKSRSRPCSN